MVTAHKRNRNKKMGKKKRFSRYCRILIRLGLVVSILYCGSMLLKPVFASFSSLPMFNTNHLTVVNNRYLKSEDIIRVSGLELGKSIYHQNLVRASEKIKNKFVIEDVVIYRRLPDEVVIEINEHVPVALVRIKQIIGVNSAGIFLPHIGKAMKDSLPHITGTEKLYREALVSHIQKGIDLLVMIKEKYPAILPGIKNVHVADLNSLKFRMKYAKCDILFGSDQWKEKIDDLPRILEKFRSELDKFKYLDMRFPRRLFVRKKEK